MSEDNNQEPVTETPEISVESILQNEELVAALKEKLAPAETTEPDNTQVKENIGKAYEARDAALKEVEALKAEKREHELKALEEAGKKEEADKMRMDELKAQLEASQAQITSLTRDSAVTAAVASLEFTSEKAAKIAVDDIVGTLVQNAEGTWVSPTGQSITDYVKFYSEQEDNRFLFKTKQSTGSSSMGEKTASGPVDTNKSLKDMTDAEMIEAAAEGKLDGNGTWY